jgi:hypothetical protein
MTTSGSGRLQDKADFFQNPAGDAIRWRMADIIYSRIINLGDHLAIKGKFLSGADYRPTAIDHQPSMPTLYVQKIVPYL